MAANGKRTKGQRKAEDRRNARRRDKKNDFRRDVMLGKVARRETSWW